MAGTAVGMGGGREGVEHAWSVPFSGPGITGLMAAPPAVIE